MGVEVSFGKQGRPLPSQLARQEKQQFLMTIKRAASDLRLMQKSARA
jgi:hypothetical protein